MAPKIQFCRGAHDNTIAFAVDGDGPALLCPPWWVSHVERDWEEPKFARFFDALASSHTVVRYDRAGVGLSDRERSDYTLEYDVDDMVAVVDHLGFERISLLGVSCGGPIAVSYVSRLPHRVERLVLYGSFADGNAIALDQVKEAVAALVRAHWGLGAKTLTDIFAPDLSKVEAKRLSATQREAASADTAAELLALTYRMDITQHAGAIEVPTLVIHRRGDRAIGYDSGRDLAARVPGATFCPLEGSAHAPWFGDSTPVLEAVFEFLGGSERPQVAPSAEPTFRREGDVWMLAFDGRRSHLKHAKGLSDLAALLSQPQTEVHVLDLVDGFEGARERVSADPVLDPKARAAFRVRTEELDAEIAEAEANADMGRLEGLRAERDSLIRELESATGLGGRARGFSDPAERARKAVAARIRDSIGKIRSVLPELAEHLEGSVTTGVFCSYSPKIQVGWAL